MTICISNKFPEDAKLLVPSHRVETLYPGVTCLHWWNTKMCFGFYVNLLSFMLPPYSSHWERNAHAPHTYTTHHTHREKTFRITKTKVVWNLSFPQTVILQLFQNRTKKRERSPLGPGFCGLPGLPVHTALWNPSSVISWCLCSPSVRCDVSWETHMRTYLLRCRIQLFL